MHRSSGHNSCEIEAKESVEWGGVQSVEDWLKRQPLEKWKEDFHTDGFLVIEKLIEENEIQIYRDIYDRMLKGDIDTSSHRHDLGNHVGQKKENTENICQIMWPTLYVKHLDEGPIHKRALAVAQCILGDDIVHDFDMLISKAPQTDTITPWHQDESYWLDMADKRAVSAWCALDIATPENGCMWFVPGSHKLPLRPHKPAAAGTHVLTCEGSESEGRPSPLPAGGCTFHSGQTMHYTRGNTTDTQRRAFIVNYRPQKMVEFERKNNYDHGKSNLKGALANTGQTHK